MPITKTVKSSPLSRAIGQGLACALCGCAALVAFHSIQTWRSAEWMNSLNPDSLKRAVAIEPRNVVARYRLAESLRLVLQDDDAAAEQFDTTLRQDPYACAALLSFSETQRARLEVAHAAELRQRAADCDPSNPRFQVTVANAYFVAGENARGLAVVQRAIRANPDWRTAGFETAWRASLPIDDYLALAQSDAATFTAAFGILLDHDDFKHLLAAEQRAEQLGIRLDDKLLLPAVDDLVGAGLYADARKLWSAYALRHPEMRTTEDDPLADPTFSVRPLNRGFGWSLRTIPGVSAVVSSGPGLELHLDHVKSARLGLEQIVLLQPGLEYEMSAEYSSEIVSISDLQLAIHDLRSQREVAVLALHAGATQNSTTFRMPAGGDGAVVVSLVTAPGAVADGTVRLSSVRLRKTR